ncbi:hypothetical protein [Halomarina oriensis]|uniref:Uncharacterized protein n=1 Tax=Halomarina oriensis TaxID=671145 RepID=A0A6B0GQM3_9EURY|nr:hypothetical protein [Halomarina oriensis]MWG35889.1 hypothetical protein [Halomarina oriensis]
MSSQHEESSDPRPKRIIYEAREEVQRVRNQFWRESVHLGRPRPSTKRELATVAIQFYDVLSEHSDEKAVTDEWTEAIDVLRESLDSTTTVAVEAPGDTTAMRHVERPAITQLSANTIVSVTKQLDRCAKALGFGAQIRDPTHHDEATLEHLEQFTMQRGQATAMDHAGVRVQEEAEEETESGGPTVMDE